MESSVETQLEMHRDNSEHFKRRCFELSAVIKTLEETIARQAKRISELEGNPVAYGPDIDGDAWAILEG